MADDMSSKLMEVLSNPEMMKKIGDVMGSLGMSEESTNPPQDESTATLKVSAKNLMNSINQADDRRITLLNALKPYLRESRASGVDKAIKMLKITKLTEFFKNEGF